MAKKKISPKSNWGDVMAELRWANEEQLSLSTELFEMWSLADLRPLFDDPFGQSAYLRKLASKNKKKRKKAQKTAEKFRIAMRECFGYIFDGRLTEEQIEEVVAICESSANGALCSLIAGADKGMQFNATMRARIFFVDRMLGD